MLDSLTSCSTLAGKSVVDADGAEIGRLDHIVIDVPTGRIAYAVIARGGVFGIGETFLEVPWAELAVDERRYLLILRNPGFYKL